MKNLSKLFKGIEVTESNYVYLAKKGQKADKPNTSYLDSMKKNMEKIISLFKNNLIKKITYYKNFVSVETIEGKIENFNGVNKTNLERTLK